MTERKSSTKKVLIVSGRDTAVAASIAKGLSASGPDLLMVNDYDRARKRMAGGLSVSTLVAPIGTDGEGLTIARELREKERCLEFPRTRIILWSDIRLPEADKLCVKYELDAIVAADDLAHIRDMLVE